MQYFTFYKKENYLAYTKTRPGEVKIGETIASVANTRRWQEELNRSASRFVIVGIPEDIGVKANHGTGGTATAWPAFLSAFFNIQDNSFLQGESILLLGYFDFSEFGEKVKGKQVEFLREIVLKIDQHVTALVEKIVAAGKIPILIGGGHNNAYGAIRGSAIGLQSTKKIRSQKINVINLDAHADLRPLEGRHSGNAFSYALHEGYLKKYGVLGLQENYVTQSMQAHILKNKNILALFSEDILVRGKLTFEEAAVTIAEFTKDTYCGIEIDLDAIENILTSAVTPCGFSSMQARQFVHQAAAGRKVAYLHICEGIARAENGKVSDTTGKLIAFLVSDFIKAIDYA